MNKLNESQISYINSIVEQQWDKLADKKVLINGIWETDTTMV
jgi:hypothetical protein